MRELPWDLPNVHEVAFTVPPELIDGMGQANNAEYLKWLDIITWDHTKALRLGWDKFTELNCGLVARHTEMDYLAAGTGGDELRLDTRTVANNGRISTTRRYQIIGMDNSMTWMRAHTRWVYIAIDSGKPRPMPPEFIQGYAVTARETR